MIIEVLAGLGVAKLLETKPPLTKEQQEAIKEREKMYIISHVEDSFSGCMCDMKEAYVKIKAEEENEGG